MSNCRVRERSVARWSATAALFATSAGLIGCDPPEEAVGQVDDPLYYRASSIWEHRDVPVCWEFSGYLTEKEWVKETIRGQRAWSAVGNVNFVGWDSCPSTSSGIRIRRGGSMSTSRLGEGADATIITLDLGSDIHQGYTRCTNNQLNRESCLRVVAMHEFGHALGYAHEHNRPDTPDSCTKAPQGSDGDSTYGVWDLDSIMNYCDPSKELSPLDRAATEILYGARSAAAPHMADYNGDGRDDLLCHDVINGRKWIDYADSSGHFNGTDWFRDGNWCQHDTARLFTADFNGDGRADKLCHDIRDGRKWIDFADSQGKFAGTDWFRDANWCKHETAQLLVGDFNGDGRDDLLCHDTADGRKWIDYANDAGQFLGTDWFREAEWCRADGARVHVGDFNGDGRDDLLCHNEDNGYKHVDYANSSGQFLGTNWSSDSPWCRADGASLFVGDADGDGRDDLICFNSVSGIRWVDYSKGSAPFTGTNWVAEDGWCRALSSRRLFVGDYNGDGRDDLLCHDVVSGWKYIDYASSSGQYLGTDWNRDAKWCDHDGGELH